MSTETNKPDKPQPSSNTTNKLPTKLLLLFLLLPCLTVLLALTGHPRISQFLLLMTGPLVVLGSVAWRRRMARTESDSCSA